MGLFRTVKMFLGFEEEQGTLVDSQQTTAANIKREDVKNDKTTSGTRRASLIDINSLDKKIGGEMSALATEMVIIDPRGYEDSAEIAGYIKQGKPVVVNLKYLDAQEGKRLLDFVCGTVYAFEGNMQKLGGSIFLFAPSSVSIIDRKTTQPGAQQVSPRREEQNPYYEEQPMQTSIYSQAIA